MPSDGSGQAQQLTKGEYFVPTSISPDGRLLTFRQLNTRTGTDIGVLSLEGDREPEILLGSEFNERHGTISPDGGWLAYSSDESGRQEVYIQSFPNLGGKRQVSTDGGSEPMWAADGTELFYRNGDQMVVVSVSLGPPLTLGRPAVLFTGQYYDIGPATTYDVTRDGQLFVMVRSEGEPTPTEIHVVLNWSEELKRVVPSN
jgi:hypothetical protein